MLCRCDNEGKESSTEVENYQAISSIICFGHSSTRTQLCKSSCLYYSHPLILLESTHFSIFHLSNYFLKHIVWTKLFKHNPLSPFLTHLSCFQLTIYCGKLRKTWLEKHVKFGQLKYAIQSHFHKFCHIPLRTITITVRRKRLLQINMIFRKQK